MISRKTSLRSSVRKILGCSFRRLAFLEAAVTHPSYRNEHPCPVLDDFDRLEFFGDVVLNFVICRKLYRTFAEADEGLLSRLRSILVSRKILSRIARELGLAKLLRMGKSLRRQGRGSRDKVLADSFEAVIAAVFFDRGMKHAERFILENFEGYFDAKKLFRLDPNPKSSLQELVQKHWRRLPLYTSEFTAQGVKTSVSINRSKKAAAIAGTRREAEEKAARILLRSIRQDLLRASKRRSSVTK